MQIITKSSFTNLINQAYSFSICIQSCFHFRQHQNNISYTHNRHIEACTHLGTDKVRILAANIPFIQTNTSVNLSTCLKSKSQLITFTIQSGNHCTNIATFIGVVITTVIETRHHTYTGKYFIRGSIVTTVRTTTEIIAIHTACSLILYTTYFKDGFRTHQKIHSILEMTLERIVCIATLIRSNQFGGSCIG